MTAKDDSQKDAHDKPKNQLVAGMRKSRGTGTGPGHSEHHGRPGPRDATQPGPSERAAVEDHYQMGGLRWPD